MNRPISAQDVESLRSVAKALNNWRSARWYMLFSGVLSAGLAIFLYAGVTNLSGTLSELHALAANDREFFATLASLVLVLSLRVSAAFVAAVYAGYGVITTLMRWKGPPLALALEVYARRELEQAGISPTAA